MVNIAICDDDIQQCSFIEKTLIEYQKRTNEHFQIEVFYHGEELRAYLENGEYYDLIFLDIELGKMNGIEIGRWIRKEIQNHSVQIVYISSFHQYVWEVFEVSALNFLRKPFTESDIIKSLQQGILQMNEDEKVFTYKEGWEYKKILHRDILYMQRQGKKVEVITVNGKGTFYGTLEKIFKEVEIYDFFFAHRSYIINSAHITGFDRNTVTLMDKYCIPLGKGKYKVLKEYE